MLRWLLGVLARRRDPDDAAPPRTCRCRDCVRGRPQWMHRERCKCPGCVAARQAQREMDRAAFRRLHQWLIYLEGRNPGVTVSSPESDRAAAYAILGLTPGASREEINSAWRREARKYHPDRNPAGAERMRDLNMARDLLLAD